MILSVLELKLSMDGRVPVTVIVIDLRADPDILLATSVYVVVVSGDIFLVPLEETVPISGLIETDVAPVTSHCKVAGCPDVIVGELTSNDATYGVVNNFKISPFRAMPTPIAQQQ